MFFYVTVPAKMGVDTSKLQGGGGGIGPSWTFRAPVHRLPGEGVSPLHLPTEAQAPSGTILASETALPVSWCGAAEIPPPPPPPPPPGGSYRSGSEVSVLCVYDLYIQFSLRYTSTPSRYRSGYGVVECRGRETHFIG